MAKVYFKALQDCHASPEEISRVAQEVLAALVEKENLPLEKHIPIKVHFGEKGNRTYLKPETYMEKGTLYSFGSALTIRRISFKS